MQHSAESIFVVEYLREFESMCKTVLAHESGYRLTKKTEGRNSRDTVPLRSMYNFIIIDIMQSWIYNIQINLNFGTLTMCPRDSPSSSFSYRNPSRNVLWKKHTKVETPPGRIVHGRFVHGRVVHGRTYRGRFVHGHTDRGRFVHGRIVRGRIVRGRIVWGHIVRVPTFSEGLLLNYLFSNLILSSPRKCKHWM
jgi:hypothetical protein